MINNDKTLYIDIGLIVNPIPNITIPNKYGTHPLNVANCAGKINPIIAAINIHTKNVLVANLLTFDNILNTSLYVLTKKNVSYFKPLNN